MLSSRELTVALNLSPEQETRVNTIVYNAVQRLNWTVQQTANEPSETRAEVALQILRGSWEEVMGLLNEEQVERWNDLLRQSDRKR